MRWDTIVRRHLANLIRKSPFLLRIPFFFWRWIQPRYTVGVVGVILNDHGQVLLVEHVFHRLAWGLPGGWVGRAEKPGHAVQREFLEELQLNIQAGGVILTSVEKTNHLDMAFICRQQGAIGSLSRELLDYRWWDIANLPRLYNFHYQAIMRAQELINGNSICLQDWEV